MTTYNSYEEAKIANPESNIYVLDGKFQAGHEAARFGEKKCNPADHCMTVEQFLNDGHEFVEGDVCINMHYGVEEVLTTSSWNEPSRTDNERYILRAAALEKPTESVVNGSPKRTKVEYVKVDFASDKEKAEAFIEGGLRYFTHGKVRGDLERDTIPVTRLDELLCGNAIYRRIETEITERDEFIEAYALATHDEIENIDMIAGMLFDSGKFKLVEGE